MTSPAATAPDRIAVFTGVALLALLAARLIAIGMSNVELYADEAQYWRWSQTFEFGYYSKPPMIAWVIGSVTALFGNAEWAIRLPAPFLHTLAAGALFCLGRDMFSARVGMFAALGYALMPGVIVSSWVLSTDGILLPFWCCALALLWRLRSEQLGWRGAVALGVCMGAGFLSKYAMLYFFIGLALTTVFDPATRRGVMSLKGLSALGLGVAVMAPHFIWNAVNDFKTVGHTVDNANLGGDLINPENFGKFLEDQMAVFGPISFLALLGGIYAFTLRRPKSGARDLRDLWLLAFIVPVLVFIAGQAVLSRAHANWAATAYPAASVLVAAWLIRAKPRAQLWIAIAAIVAIAFQFAPDISLLLKLSLGLGFGAAILIVGLSSKWRAEGLLWTSIGIHGVVAGLLVAVVALPPIIMTTLGMDNAFKRVRGWEETAAAVAELARREAATAILVDEREIWHGLDYYLRDRDHPPLIAWRRNPGPKSFSETRPLDDTLDSRVLVVSFRPHLRPRIRGDFMDFSYADEIAIALGQRSNGCPIERRFVVYVGEDYLEAPRDEAWEARYEGLSERPNPPCPTR